MTQAIVHSSPKRGIGSLINPAYLPLLATLLVVVAMLAGGSVGFEKFFSVKTVLDLFNSNAFIGVAAIGATIVILSGGIDLSVGSVVAFTTILMAKLIHPALSDDGVSGMGMHPMTAAIISLVVGAAFGACMGMLIHFFELPPFMVTLAGMFLARAAGFLVHNVNLGISHEFLSTTLPGWSWHVMDIAGRRGNVFPIYLQFHAIVMIVMFLIAMAVLHLSAFGRNIYAVGGDENSAKLLGVPVGRTKILVYTLSGFFSALAGVVLTIYKTAGNPADQIGLELDAIAAVVIGGTLLTGGRGYVIGTLLGVLVLGLIQALIINASVNSAWTRIVVGSLMLIFIVLQIGFSALTKRLTSSSLKPA